MKRIKNSIKKILEAELLSSIPSTLVKVILTSDLKNELDSWGDKKVLDKYKHIVEKSREKKIRGSSLAIAYVLLTIAAQRGLPIESTAFFWGQEILKYIKKKKEEKRKYGHLRRDYASNWYILPDSVINAFDKVNEDIFAGLTVSVKEAAIPEGLHENINRLNTEFEEYRLYNGEPIKFRIILDDN